MSSSAQNNAASPAPQSGNRPTRAVPMKECAAMGMVAAALVFVMTIIFTSAWDGFKPLALCGLYTVVTFLVVTLVAMGLNWVVKSEEVKDPHGPVMH